MTLYQHRQTGRLLLVLLLAAAALELATGWIHPIHFGLFLVPAAALALLAWLFSSLMVVVDREAVCWHFGPGWRRHRVPLVDILSVEPVRTHWINGFGIRRKAGVRLYNVSGVDAVEITLKSGTRRRIGTDDPHELASALKRAIGR